MTEVQREPNPVDIHVGDRIRMRRRVRGLSQEALAEALGLTFQQVQKYESGANRVSASKLFTIAAALEVPVNYFFEGLPVPGQARDANRRDEQTENAIRSFLATAEGLELALRFPLIPRRRLRRQVVDLVRALSETAGPEAEIEPEEAAPGLRVGQAG